MSRRGWEIVFIVAAAAFLRFLFLGKQSFWFDEAFSAWMSAHPPGEMLSIIRAMDAHPPLFYLFLHGWMAGGRGEAYLRIPFACFGIANCAAVYFLAEDLLGKRMALISSFFWTCSLAALAEETQTRMYAMALCFSLLATLFLWKAVKSAAPGKWRAAYLLFAILSLYTHYYTGFIVAAHVIFLAAKKLYKEAGIVIAVLLAAYAPWLPSFLHQLLSGAGEGLPATSWSGFIDGLAFLLVTRRFFEGLSLLAVSAAGIAAAVCGARALWKENRDGALLLVLLFAVPCAVPFAVSRLTPQHVYGFRYAIFFAPYFFLLFLAGVFSLPRSAAGAVFVALICVNVSVWLLFLTGGAYQRQNWREAAALIGPRLEAGDAVYVEQGMAMFPLAYYLPDRVRLDWNGSGLDAVSLPADSRVRWIPVTEKSAPAAISPASVRSWLVMCQPGAVDPDHIVLSTLAARNRTVLSYALPAFDQADTIYILLFSKRFESRP